VKRIVIAAAALLLVALGACTLLGPRVAPASNDRCHVCHINYAEEKLAVTHARRGVGCEKCHGPSDAHCGSEEHEIPPDRMYAKDAVNPACMQCHSTGKLAAQDMHALNRVATPTPKKHCTECHGSHVLPKRHVRWDKATRKLLPPPPSS
jgi:hypothetical protein